MAKRVDAGMRELMLAEYAALKSYRAVGRRLGVSPNTVSAAVKSAEAGARVKSEAAFIERHRERAQDFVDLCFDVLEDRDKLEKSPINQITSAMGTMLDKFAMPKREERGGFAEAIESAWRARRNG